MDLLSNGHRDCVMDAISFSILASRSSSYAVEWNMKPRMPACGWIFLEKLSKRSAEEKCGIGAPYKVPSEQLSSGATGRGPPFSSPKNDSSTDNFHLVPGKATGTQHKPLRATVKPELCKTTGAELPKAFRALSLQQCTLEVGYGVKGDYFGA
ncbi:hypothetical protein AAY473_017353 [Plecturocebus cupreus]